MNLKLTPTHKRMYDLLRDGKSHRSTDLLKCLGDTEASIGTMRVHMHSLRNKLSKIGHSVMLEVLNGKSYYRLITSPELGPM